MQLPQSEKIHPDALPQAWAEKLIARLRLSYGTRFLQAWEGVDMIELARHWSQEMAGFTGAEIAAGLAACKTRPWPPTLPEFMALCRPWMEPEVAFQEAVAGMSARRKGERGKWSHPAVYWAAVRVGTHDLLACGWQTLRNRWETALREALADEQLVSIPEPAPALPAPGQTHLDRKNAQAQCSNIQRMTGLSSAPARAVKDHKAWARKILENPKGRTLTVIRMAQRALGIEDEPVQKEPVHEPQELAA